MIGALRVEASSGPWDEHTMTLLYTDPLFQTHDTGSGHPETARRLSAVVGHLDRTCEEGLSTEIRIAQTPLGDETLALAAEDMLSASIGFKAAPQDMKLDRHTMTRRIHRAFLDHVSFVEDPAYEGARILAVRHNGDEPEPQQEPETSSKTPLLDQWSDDEMLRWAAARLNKLADSS